MAFVVKDRVKQSTTTTGTGSIVLNGTVSGFQTFANALSDGDTTYYSLFEVSTNEWEVGVGTWTEGTTTLARTTILASSNSGSAVNLTAQAEVFIAQPAGKAAFFDPSGDLTLVQDPTSNLQAATKQYVDTIAAAGLHYHDPVRVEQEGNLSATYSNGTAGVGATLTNNSTQAALTIDGVALSLNDRVLIYEQTNGYENGIYTVTNVGSASTNWVLTRATDADSYAPSDPDSLGQGDAFFVLEGAAGAGELYVMNTSGTITFGTTNITFTQVAATAVYSAGTGLTLTGTQFSADGANITNVDAVTLDGIDSSQFLRSDVVDTKTAGNLNFSDNVKAQFGDSSDLQIYHDASNSYIVDGGTGDLKIQGANVRLENPSGVRYFQGSSGNTYLYNSGNIKLTTTSTGIDVTGTVTADSLTVDGLTKIQGSATGLVLNETDTTDLNTYFNNNGGVLKLFTTNDAFSSFTERLRIDHATGDISFYEDTGTTAKFFWDASTERLSIGNASPATALDVTGTVTADGLTLETNNASINFTGTTGNNFINVKQGLRIDIDNDNNQGATSFGITHGGGTGNVFNASENGDISFYNTGGSVQKFFWDASAEAVGIGTISPTHTISLESAYPYISFNETDQSQKWVIGGATGNFVIYDDTDAATRLAVDGSGNLLVGKTASDTGTSAGFEVSSGTIYPTRSGASTANFNRLTSDGNIVNFRKDGTTVGSIGSAAGSRLFIGNGDTGIRFAGGLDTIVPWNTNNSLRDAAIDLGEATGRFKDLYLSGSLSDGTTSRTVADIVGLTSSQFLRSDADDTATGTITLAAANFAEQLEINRSGGAFYSVIKYSNTAGELGKLGFTQNSNLIVRLGTSGTDNTIWHSGNDGTGSGLDADLLDGVQGSSYLRSDQADTIDGNLTIGGTAHIAMQEDHYVNRRFDVDSADNSGTIYILLCRNAANNDVNGTITMDRTSCLRFACSWDIIVSSGSSTTPIGSLTGHSLAGAGQPSARLVTLTYSSLSYVALELTNPDLYYETTGAYFNGRIVNSGSNTFTVVTAGQVSAISSMYISTSRTIMSNNLEVGNSIYVPNQIIHDDDDDTNITFGTDTITLNAGGSAEVTIDTTGVRLGDTGNGYFQPVTGTFGSIQIDGGAHSGYEGYSIGGVAVWMTDSATYAGLYNDANNQWWMRGIFNGQTDIYYQGTSKLQTTSTGASVTGVFTADSVAEDYDALSGTTPTCNIDNAGAFSLTMTGNTTFTFSGADSGYSNGFILQLTGNATTAYTVTWPTSVDWAGGTAPDAPAVGETDIYVFWTRDGGTTWYGVLSVDAAA